MKVIAIVRFNSGYAIVTYEHPKLIYTKYGNTTVGTDGTFTKCYYYEKPDEHWQAFGGSKFDIQLSDGTIEKCYGQWWDGVSGKAIEVLGERPVNVTVGQLEALKSCYVFTGYTAIKSKYDELVSQYKGIIWDYWDYEKTISNNPYRRKEKPVHFKKYRNQKRVSKSIFN